MLEMIQSLGLMIEFGRFKNHSLNDLYAFFFYSISPNLGKTQL